MSMSTSTSMSTDHLGCTTKKSKHPPGRVLNLKPIVVHRSSPRPRPLDTTGARKKNASTPRGGEYFFFEIKIPMVHVVHLVHLVRWPWRVQISGHHPGPGEGDGIGLVEIEMFFSNRVSNICSAYTFSVLEPLYSAIHSTTQQHFGFQDWAGGPCPRPCPRPATTWGARRMVPGTHRGGI